MKKLFLAISLVFSLVYIPQADIDLPRGAKKKVLKSFTALWPDTEIQPLLIAEEEIIEGDISRMLKRLQLYKLETKQGVLGHLFLSAAPSRYNDFDLMVIYDLELKIIDTKVLTYHEDWGGEIGSKRWLKQFLNKTSTDQLIVGRDIQGISGATISVKSATRAIRLMTAKLEDLREKGLLD